MKKALITAAAIIFLAAGISFAEDHEQMHEMMLKQGGPKADDRIELTIPEPMKVMHKGMMRRHENWGSGLHITQHSISHHLSKV